MREPIRILLQTTIPERADDWHVGRFSMLRTLLESQFDESGNPLFALTARDRAGVEDDPVLGALDTSNFDELWLFAVDGGDGLSAADHEGITRFHRRGGGLLVTRDHQDVGSSVYGLESVGGAHFFHSKNRELDESRRVRDDMETHSISWPNYHSGRNGDFQKIAPVEPVHELLRNLRLDAVHERLRANPAASITATALDFGFGHLGRFAAYYAERFGELPRQTLHHASELA